MDNKWRVYLGRRWDVGDEGTISAGLSVYAVWPITVKRTINFLLWQFVKFVNREPDEDEIL